MAPGACGSPLGAAVPAIVCCCPYVGDAFLTLTKDNNKMKKEGRLSLTEECAKTGCCFLGGLLFFLLLFFLLCACVSTVCGGCCGCRGCDSRCLLDGLFDVESFDGWTDCLDA